MALPENYKAESAACNLGRIAVCRASHPIHGMVAVYKPAEHFSQDQLTRVKQSLYQHGLWLRDVSERAVPGIESALEVSQNPEDPYIVTAWREMSLAAYLESSPKLKRSTALKLFRGICEALTNAEIEGFLGEKLKMSDIKFDTGNTPMLATLGMLGESIGSMQRTMTIPSQSGGPSTGRTQTLRTATLKDKSVGALQPTVTIPQSGTVTLATHAETAEALRKNMYVLGTILFGLLFGEAYHSADLRSAQRIKRLPPRWRAIFNRLIDTAGDAFYDSQSALLHDVRCAMARNRRIAIACMPMVVLVLILATWWGSLWYKEYNIRHSTASDALRDFISLADRKQDLPVVPAPIDGNSLPDRY